MQIRSATCFVNAGIPSTWPRTICKAGRVAHETRTRLESAGIPVQTTRLAIQPLSPARGDPLAFAKQIWDQCEESGFEYLSLGPIEADSPDADLSLLERLADLICGTEVVFSSVLVARHGRGLNLEAIKRTAAAILEIAHGTDLGFGNLRLAMLANVEPHAPFFPAAYHDGGAPALALAVEGASLAVESFSGGGSLEQVRMRLAAAIKEAAGHMTALVQPLAVESGYRFVGFDFTLAPFPDDLRSIGAAIEQLGVERFGAPGTLFAASFLTSCLRSALPSYPSCGFNGLMLPVLEDSRLAERSHEKVYSVNDLLLYSAVCGTGLDTVPLPGDVSEKELSGILLDVATLALRLNKPLTARLMPIPGARAGDTTQFDFPYFANSRVLDVKGHGSQRLFDRGGYTVT
jgi:hypothetical protein